MFLASSSIYYSGPQMFLKDLDGFRKKKSSFVQSQDKK